MRLSGSTLRICWGDVDVPIYTGKRAFGLFFPIKPDTCGSWQVQSRKGKEVKGVPAQQNPKLFPWNADKLGKVSSSTWNICILWVILFPSRFKSVQPNSQLWICCSAQIQQVQVVWDEAPLLSFINSFWKLLTPPCCLPWDLIYLVEFQVTFAFVWWFQRKHEGSDFNKIGSQEGYWLRNRQPAQTTCLFMFLNFVPWVVLFTWNHGYLVHPVSQSTCASAL